MSTNWKKSLKKFLHDSDEKKLKVALRNNWVDIYPEDKEVIYHFLIKTRLNKLFTYLVGFDLQNQLLEIPWLPMLNLLSLHKVKIPKEHFDELNKLLVKQKVIQTTASNEKQLLESLKAKKRYAFLQKVEKKKQELMASAEIAKSERLMKQHIEYMNELKKFSPSEYSATSTITDEEKNRAELILKRRNKKRASKKSLEKNSLGTEEQALIDIISKQAQSYYKKGQARASDFAYLLRSLGEAEKAIDFIYDKEESNQKDWQLLEYLFHGKQYLSLLGHCANLKKKHAQYPDALFSVYYIEAVAYWELGEKEKALELMGQISSMRPDFKSASEILSQWKEDVFE